MIPATLDPGLTFQSHKYGPGARQANQLAEIQMDTLRSWINMVAPTTMTTTTAVVKILTLSTIEAATNLIVAYDVTVVQP